ncbi:MAG: DUF5050 domain-containing protein [Saccharofermentanales bacterium]
MEQYKGSLIRYFKLSVHTLLAFILMMISLASCSDEPAKTLTNIPSKPLYDSFDIKDTSLQSGNFYYNGFLTTDGTWIYFQSDDGKSLVKSGFSGNYLRLVTRRFPSFINVIDNTVFFIEGSNSGKIYKVDTDGKGETLVVDSIAKSLIATQTYLFYIDTKDGFVYRTMHDGSKRLLLFDQVTAQIQSINNVLYFFPAGESNGFYKIPMDAVKTISTSPSVISSPESAVSLVDIGLTSGNYKSLNIQGDRFFYIDNTKNQSISVFDKKSHKNFLKAAIDSPFILSGKYIYYVNPDDESRLYRVSSDKPKDNKMIINDRVSQFVICGNSIYYRRENNLEIYRTPIEGGISYKIT